MYILESRMAYKSFLKNSSTGSRYRKFWSSSSRLREL